MESDREVLEKILQKVSMRQVHFLCEVCDVEYAKCYMEEDEWAKTIGTKVICPKCKLKDDNGSYHEKLKLPGSS